MQRAHYVAVLWCNANTASPDQGLSPTDYGWSVKDDLLQPVWFDGPATPSVLFTEENESGSDSDDTIIQTSCGHDGHEGSDIELSDDDPWSEDSDSDSEIPE